MSESSDFLHSPMKKKDPISEHSRVYRVDIILQPTHGIKNFFTGQEIDEKFPQVTRLRLKLVALKQTLG